MWGERNCLSFETAAGGIEPPSSRLTVRRSTARPPLVFNCILTKCLYLLQSAELAQKEEEETAVNTRRCGYIRVKPRTRVLYYIYHISESMLDVHCDTPSSAIL